MSRRNSQSANDSHEAYCPQARTEDLVTTASGDELLVYDQGVHHIHHLNVTAKLVLEGSNGVRTVSDLADYVAKETGAFATDSTILHALSKLSEADLLAHPLPTSLQSHSRRAFLKKAAAAGLITPAVIQSVSAPAAADSHSGNTASGTLTAGQECAKNEDCYSGYCQIEFPFDTGFCG